MKAYRSKKTIILYLAPLLVGMAVFIYYPLIQSVLNSLYRWAAFSPQKAWVGLDNYRALFGDPLTWSILSNNLRYAFYSVIFQVGVAVVFAACLEETFMRRTQSFFRTVLFLPSVVSMTVIALLWQAMLNPNSGLVNTLIHAIGFTEVTPQWLGDSDLAIYCCIFVSQWQYIGYCMLLDLIGIQKIPQEIFESARIDGATRIQNFFYITLPLVKESILVTSIITVLGAFKVFTEVFVMTGGGPGRSSEVLATAMYRAAFRNDEMGIASAFAIIIFVITALLSFLQLRLSRSGQE